MPHQCIRCGKIYSSGSKQLLEGCDACNSKFFFFIKEKDLQESKEIIAKLTPNTVKQMEKDVREIVSEKVPKDKPIILDFETVRMTEPGKFMIDIGSLFRGKPVIINISDGKYYIDLQSVFDA